MATWEWDELKCKGGPSARSGHRMLCHQGKLYLFGGFYDAGDVMPKYYRDLWAFDIDSMKWEGLADMRHKWPQVHRLYMHSVPMCYVTSLDVCLINLPQDVAHHPPHLHVCSHGLDCLMQKHETAYTCSLQARSAFQWVAHEGKLILHGGYAKQVDDDDNEMEHGTALGDTWCWHITEQKVCIL
jgi:Kelch motif